MLIGIVYKITNKITNKNYIGQTVRTLKTRWSAHCRQLDRNSALVNSIKKYGKDSFEIKVLSRCNNLDQMDHRERYYIKLFNTLAPNGYNIETGGNKHKKLSDTTKKKMSDAKKKNPVRYWKNKKRSIETKLKMPKFTKGNIPWNKNIPHSDETKKKISEANIGHVAWNKGLTKDLDKRVELYSIKRYKLSEEQIKTIKELYSTKLNGKQFYSYRHLAGLFDISVSTVNRCLSR